MIQTDEAELRADSDRLQAQRPDVIKQAFDAHREVTVTEAINSTFDTYGPFLTQENARAIAWGWIESCASRCEWDSVRIVLAAFRARFPA